MNARRGKQHAYNNGMISSMILVVFVSIHIMDHYGIAEP